MISVSNKEAQNIFLTTKTKIVDTNRKLNVIVSPEFYWVRKFEIPVKSEAQARHVLPTLFEDIVQENEVLTYQVIKLEENKFLCFAFNNKKIYEAIKNSNIQNSNINSLYFAQNECKEFKTFEVDGINFMNTSEGILVKVPSSLEIESINLNKVINNIRLSSYKLQIKLYNDVISGKFYNILFSIFTILIIINFIKYFSYSNEIVNINENLEKVKKDNNLPSSMIQTNSILNNYENILKNEITKREAINYVISNKKFKLKSLNIDNKTLVLDYISTNKNELESFLKKRFKNIKLNQQAFNIKVNIKL